MTSPTAYVTLAAMYALRNVSGALPTTRQEFAQIVEDRYKWRIDENTIDKIMRQLDAWGFITIIEDKYAGEMIRPYRARSDEALESLAERGYGDLIAKASVGSVPWFVKIFNNQDFWNDLHNDPLPVPDNTAEPNKIAISDEVPASDRIVRRSDNRAAVELIESDVRGLVEEVSSNNEVGDELGDDRDIIVGELNAAETLLSQPAFRSARLYSLIMPVLRFLADKFASGAIGEMAKRLIAAILGLG